MSIKLDEENLDDERDKALNKILAAVRAAAPPGGMEARIAQRLRQQATTRRAVPFLLRDIFTNVPLASAWWRGAITGAAAALLLTGVSLVAGHLLQVHPGRASTEMDNPATRHFAPAATPVSTILHGSPANDNRAPLCANPAMLRTVSAVPARTINVLRAETRIESEAPSRPAPPLPLTNQERALVRLAQTATPQQIAVINPAEYANLEAQSALKFEKFFAPPAPLPAENRKPAIITIADPNSASEDEPKRDSVVNPAAASEEKP